jgi:hypothetical protein
MKELKFPVFEKPLPPARTLSMDEYLAFVMQLRRNPPPRQKPQSEERSLPRHAPFRLP